MNTASIEKAAELLKTGFLVVIPTDTVYGLAADPSVPGAKDKIFEAKKRDRNKPVAILVSDIGRAERMGATVDKRARKLADKYWPGALTMVLKTGDGYEGFRAPSHPVALALLAKTGGILYATSVNISGQPVARSAQEAAAALGDAVSFVLDTGPEPAGTESTVVKISETGVDILREGALSRKEIEECLANS